MGPGDLHNILNKLPSQLNKNVVVSYGASDDAGVIKLSRDLALVQTCDFFSPVVDDPYTYGKIAAANALSDVYAMGGTPISALNIVGFPIDNLPMAVLKDILAGGSDIIKESGAALLGGHSVEDLEVKYGLSVTGTIHPNKVWHNAGARVGDQLILTKPLGIGLVTNTVKKERSEKKVLAEAVKWMTTLNHSAAEAAKKYSVTTCTDITGFGLVGHCSEIALASKVGFEINAEAIPYIDQALYYSKKEWLPKTIKKNRRFIGPLFQNPKKKPRSFTNLLFDPQTSGGLLIAVRPAHAKKLLGELNKRGLSRASIIGECVKGKKITLV